ncbi:MAG: cache domain-containing protein [Desulfatitalea sp.]|nr:cache domain-containing protein [Desulfatitalea sp.]
MAIAFGPMAMAEEAPQKVKDLAHGQLAALGKASAIVFAVKAENAKGKSMDQIKAMDAKWQATPGISSEMKALMESACSLFLKSIQDSQSYFSEIFVMDNQGANVAMTVKTSDYWQGDEAKFKKAFNEGNGAVFVDEVKFDDSAQAYLVQVSVPVWDGSQAIGAVTFGIDVDKIDNGINSER